MKRFYIIFFSSVFAVVMAVAGCIYLVNINTYRIKNAVINRLEDTIEKKVWINGDLDIKFQLPFTVSVEDIQIQNAPWGSASELAKIQQLEVKMGLLSLLSGNIEIYELRLKSADLFLEISKTGAWNFDPRNTNRTKPSLDEDSVLNIGKIRIIRSRLIYRNRETGKLYPINISNLTASIDRHGERMSFDTQSAYQKIPFSLNGSLQPVNALLKSNKPLTVRINAASGQNRVDGQITVEMSKDPPVLKADLNSSYLDLRDFIFEKSADGNESRDVSSLKKDDRLFSSEPLNLNFLSNSKADIQIKAKRVLLPYLAMNDFECRINIEEGRLSINPIKADLESGRIGGEFFVEVNNQIPAIDVKIRMKNLNLEPTIDDLGITEAITGTVGVDLNLDGRGRSPADIMADLNGKITIVMQSGQIAAKYLKDAEKFNMDISDNFLKLFAFTKKKKDFAEINCFVCGFKLKDGIADSKALVFDTERIGIVGDGTVNLKTERLDISLKPIEKGGIGTQQVNVGLGEIADLFKLGGTLSHPAITIDKSETAISTVITLGKAIGGTLLFGPAGLAAALVDLDFSDNDPCISALKEAATEEKNQ